jgi:adenylate kinase family enzyme
MTRVSIIGHAGGGQSTLARRLGAWLALPIYRVDLLQWRPGWQPAPAEVIGGTHAHWLAQPAWIIDGWGGWPALAERFERADTLILVDFPLATHYWWAMKRQVRGGHAKMKHAKRVCAGWPAPASRPSRAAR